jgi:hypothetical protein
VRGDDSVCGARSERRLPNGGELGIGVGGEAVDRNDDRNAEAADDLDVRGEVGGPAPDGLCVVLCQRRIHGVARDYVADSAMHRECAHRGDQHGGVRPEAGNPAFDVEELFRAYVRSESGLGAHDVIGH